MFTAVEIKKNTFRDSVYLMRISSLLRTQNGVIGAEVIMGTEHNKNFLEQGGLLTPEIERDAEANDMIIVVKAEEENTAREAIKKALNELSKEADAAQEETVATAFTVDTAINSFLCANLAVLSIPGQYVEREAIKILDAGLNLFIFSDNVPLETEIMLKKIGVEKKLLVMGPDCGTAIINGIPIAFANELKRGSIGLVAAAGTGLQEVSCLISNMGEGISQGIGTGGRDVKESVGGMMMLLALDMLLEDQETEIVVVISKPPADSVVEKVIQRAARGNKPVVLNFIGSEFKSSGCANCYFATTLKEAAEIAVSMLRKGKLQKIEGVSSELQQLAREKRSTLQVEQKYLRGLFSGGTLAYEALLLTRKTLGSIYSNIALDDRYKLKNSYISEGHTIIDMGEDEFTQGRPHPMIEPELRNRFIIKEAGDPETAIIMVDIVLGYGSHPDPAGRALTAIREANKATSETGREVLFVASVCGTDSDPQDRSKQIEMLQSEGVLVFSSNTEAALFVGEVLK